MQVLGNIAAAAAEESRRGAEGALCLACVIAVELVRFIYPSTAPLTPSTHAAVCRACRRGAPRRNRGALPKLGAMLAPAWYADRLTTQEALARSACCPAACYAIATFVHRAVVPLPTTITSAGPALAAAVVRSCLLCWCTYIYTYACVCVCVCVCLPCMLRHPHH